MNIVGAPPLSCGLTHQGIADGIEGLDEMRVRNVALQAFHQRPIEVSKELENAVLGIRIGDWVGRVNHRLAR